MPTSKENILRLVPIYVILVFCLFFPLKTSAIGQTTKPIVVDTALRGQVIEQELLLLNTENREVEAILVSEGETKLWVDFFNLDELTATITSIVLEPKEKKKILAVIRVPDDMPNSEYNGYISVMRKPDEIASSSETSATIKQKISRQVKITVTDTEIVAFTALVIPEKYDLITGESLSIRVVYKNQGNIAVKPQLSIKIRQAENIFYNVIHPYPEGEGGVKPLGKHEIPPINIPVIGVADGKARLEVISMYNDKEITNETIRFSYGLVKPKPIIADVAEEKSFNILEKIPNPGLINSFWILAVCAFLISMFFGYKYMRVRNL